MYSGAFYTGVTSAAKKVAQARHVKVVVDLMHFPSHVPRVGLVLVWSFLF